MSETVGVIAMGEMGSAVARRLHERGGATHAGNDDWNCHRIQQHRQQDVAAARPHEHCGKQRSD